VHINSSVALVIYSVLMVGMCVFATFVSGVPYLAFASEVTLGFIAYITKRLWGHKKEYSDRE